MTRQMADDEVLRVLAMARVCVANYPSHDPMVHAGPMFDPAAAAAQFDAAVAALQAERDAANAYAERCTAANTQAERENDELRTALEALRGQVAGLVEKWRAESDWTGVTGTFADELNELLAIKERKG